MTRHFCEVKVEDYGLPWRRIKKFRSKLKQSENSHQSNDESGAPVVEGSKRRKVAQNQGFPQQSNILTDKGSSLF
jgi:hypothetical protein